MQPRGQHPESSHLNFCSAGVPPSPCLLQGKEFLLPVPAQLEGEGRRVRFSVLTGFLATSSQSGPCHELAKIQAMWGECYRGQLLWLGGSFPGPVRAEPQAAVLALSPPFWAVATPELPEHKPLDVCPSLERRATRGAPGEQSSRPRGEVPKVGELTPCLRWELRSCSPSRASSGPSSTHRPPRSTPTAPSEQGSLLAAHGRSCFSPVTSASPPGQPHPKAVKAQAKNSAGRRPGKGQTVYNATCRV